LHKPIWPLKLCNDSSLPHGHWKSNINQGNLLLSPPCLNPHSIFSIYHQFLWVVRSSKYLRFAPDQHAEWQFTKLLIKTPGGCVCVRHAVVPKIMARHYDINNFHIPAHNKSYGVWSLSEPSSPYPPPVNLPQPLSLSQRRSRLSSCHLSYLNFTLPSGRRLSWNCNLPASSTGRHPLPDSIGP